VKRWWNYAAAREAQRGPWPRRFWLLECPKCEAEYVVSWDASWVCSKDAKHEPIRAKELVVRTRKEAP